MDLNVADIRHQFHLARVENDVAEDGNLELLNASFIADSPSIFGVPDEGYIRRELDWYLSMDRRISRMAKPIPKIWLGIQDSRGLVNSNYGWCVFSEENGDQFSWAIAELKNHPNSRRAVMIYTRPSLHKEMTDYHGEDFICTNTVQMLIRGNALHMVVQMRSNDAVFGYKNDWPWHKYIQLRAINELNHRYRPKGADPLVPVTEGHIYWTAGSLHVYPRHFPLIEKWWTDYNET